MKRTATLAALLFVCWPAATQMLPTWLTSVSLVRALDGDDLRWASPTWDDRGWQSTHWALLSSYERILWLRAHVDGAALPANRDLQVALSVVGSYEVYWNGTRIGGSGKPGKSRAEEIPGSMVAILAVPAALLTRGDNVLAVRVSSFHLSSRLRSTVHLLIIGDALDPMALRLRDYLPGLAASGALLLGACYFVALFLSNRRDRAAGYLALLALAALGQFVAEAWAAFVNYAYPAHLYRLWVLLAMACVHGLSLVAYVTERCAKARQGIALLTTVVGIAAVVSLVPGYDNKTTLTIVSAAAVGCAFGLWQRPRRGLLLLFVPLSLLAVYLIAPLAFLDQYFYLMTAAAIIVLFFEQVRHLRLEQAARAGAELRSARMELELLKRYIQPHFLLNTLTSLAEWVETDPQLGVRMIEALAEEFRVLSRIGSLRTIDLREEVALCQLHLRVMSLRHDASLELSTLGLDEGRQVPPAILHTLIENALTHNHYPHGARFHLQESHANDQRCYELRCPPGRPEAVLSGNTSGTGLDYVRARLTELFADRWRLTQGRADDGGWLTRIEVPA